jgi:hypothetical protein
MNRERARESIEKLRSQTEESREIGGRRDINVMKNKWQIE